MVRALICWAFGHKPLVLHRSDWTVRCPRCRRSVWQLKR
jgi:hypothetical protein